MKTSIDEVMQEAISLHREGKLHEAEGLYTAILQDQPEHPDANHNLGVLALARGHKDRALKLFENALRLYPRKEQFWLSTIKCLVELGHIDESKKMISSARKIGVSNVKLSGFEDQIEPARKLSATPSDAQIGDLLTKFKTGNLIEAEQSARSLTVEFPQHPLGWSIHGVILKQLGRVDDAVDVMQVAARLLPSDPGVHNNLGLTLLELGRPMEAEESLRQSVQLGADLAEPHYNLALTLKEIGKLEEAQALCRRAIELKPDYAQAHNVLGTLLLKSSKWEDAEASSGLAVEFKPTYAEAYNNLAIAQTRLGKLDQARFNFQKAIELRGEYPSAMLNLAHLFHYEDDCNAESDALNKSIRGDGCESDLRALVLLALNRYLSSDFEASQAYLTQSSEIANISSDSSRNEQIYYRYIYLLLAWRKNNPAQLQIEESSQLLFVIGDSHCLTAHRLPIDGPRGAFVCESKLIMGCKQWDLGNSGNNEYKSKFGVVFRSIPKGSQVVLIFGEIDCRQDSGIISHLKKYPDKDRDEVISATVQNYINFIADTNEDCHHQLHIQGVPCPNTEDALSQTSETAELLDVIRKLNSELEAGCLKNGMSYLDAHALTDRGDGLSNGRWHLDDYHLAPPAFAEMWRRT